MLWCVSPGHDDRSPLGGQSRHHRYESRFPFEINISLAHIGPCAPTPTAPGWEEYIVYSAITGMFQEVTGAHYVIVRQTTITIETDEVQRVRITKLSELQLLRARERERSEKSRWQSFTHKTTRPPRTFEKNSGIAENSSGRAVKGWNLWSAPHYLQVRAWFNRDILYETAKMASAAYTICGHTTDFGL